MPAIDFGFDDNDKEFSSSLNTFKPKQGETYKISLAWWPGIENGTPNFTSSPKFKGDYRHYIEGIGYILDGGPEFTKLVGKEPVATIATIIVIWPLSGKKSKEIDLNAVLKEEYEVIPWILAKAKYLSLKSKHQECHLGSYDLSITCTDAKYQKLDFTPVPNGNYFRKLLASEHKTVATDIISQVNNFIPRLRNFIGRELTVDQLKEKLGMAEPLAASNAPTPADIDDMIESI